jgi:hypothetical protein
VRPERVIKWHNCMLDDDNGGDEEEEDEGDDYI